MALWHTVRYLRFEQIVARVWYWWYRPAPDFAAAPQRRAQRNKWIDPIMKRQSLFQDDTFRFLNETYDLSSVGWDQPAVAKLWRYNLHYFDDLNAEESRQREAVHQRLIERWIAENPAAQGTAWEPYPTSLRIVNWIKRIMAGSSIEGECRDSLAVQVRWLGRRLEYHILGNHLLANAKALVFAGLYFNGPEADKWLARGRELLDREIPEQILPDGGHFELSPMYHAAVVEDLLDLANLFGAYGVEVPDEWKKHITRMLRWLEVMIHPDGGIAFFNDAAFGISPTLAELKLYAARLGLPVVTGERDSVTVLKDSGYARVLNGDAYLVCDCAKVGPDYLPGHAHADTLSFELSLFGQRVFVNSGTSVYGVDAERQRQRGTAAHNTVIVDGADSSEVWAGFRVARRAFPRLISAAYDSSSRSAVIDASHDGYLRLRGRVQHRRRWALSERSLSIEDTLTGRFARAEARFHLHPEIQVRRIGAKEVELSWARGNRVHVHFDAGAAVDVSASTWHPEFGLAVANQCIAVGFTGGSLTTRVSWDAE